MGELGFFNDCTDGSLPLRLHHHAWIFRNHSVVDLLDVNELLCIYLGFVNNQFILDHLQSTLTSPKTTLAQRGAPECSKPRIKETCEQKNIQFIKKKKMVESFIFQKYKHNPKKKGGIQLFRLDKISLRYKFLKKLAYSSSLFFPNYLQLYK